MHYLKIVLLASICTTIVFSNAYALNGITPPLEQLKSGVLVQDIKCKESFVLVIKESNENPACVKLTSTERLLSHGWIRLDKFEAIHPVIQQDNTANPQQDNTITSVSNNKNKASSIQQQNVINQNINITEKSVTNTVLVNKNDTNVSLATIHSTDNTTSSISNQKLPSTYMDCNRTNTGDFPVTVGNDNPSAQIDPYSARPLPPLTIHPSMSSTRDGVIRILEIGMCPTQLKVGDTPHFTVAYQNISNEPITYEESGAGQWFGYTISPQNNVNYHLYKNNGLHFGGVGQIPPNQIAVDPGKGITTINGDIRNLLFGPYGEYQITKPGVLTITMQLGWVGESESHDIFETIQFNVNATQ